MDFGDNFKELMGKFLDTIKPEPQRPPNPFDVEANALQSGGVADAVKDYVERKTGNEAIGIAASMATPSLPIDKAMGIVGLFGLTKGQKIFRGSIKSSEALDVGISRRFTEPGQELGTHVTVSRDTANLFSNPHTAIVAEDNSKYPTIYEMTSNVDKPLVLIDTGASWNVTNTSKAIRFANARLGKNSKFSPEGLKKLDELQTAYEEEKLSMLNKIKSSKKPEDYNYIEFSRNLNNHYSKKLQDLIKSEGYDHISYINLYEGAPVESAIIFDRKDVNLFPHDFLSQ